MLKNKSALLVLGTMAMVGLFAGVGAIASAQSTAVSSSSAANSAATISQTQAVDTPEPGDVADAPGTKSATHGHAPLGGDGVVSSVNGSTIVIAEESDEGSASYTVDASKATVTNKGAAASLNDVKVGAKIFVQGAVSGTNVSATSISLGHPGSHIESANDTDGGTSSEAAEPAGSTDTSDN